LTIIRDAVGDVLSSTNQLGDTTSYSYGPVGNVLTVTNPLGKVTTNCYYYENGTGACAHGAPATGGNADALYSTLTPATTADPSGESTTFTHFSGGALDVSVNPAATTTYAYDAFGDKTSISYTGVQSGYSAPTNLSYTDNVDGSTNTMTDATGTTTYGYDANGDVTSQALVANSPLSN
jgi:YD repeat-containing protein